MTHEEMQSATPEEIFNAYINCKKFYHCEGEYGLKRLNDLTQNMGYKCHGYMYGSSLEVFLADNPGAQRAIYDWIEQNMCEEWAEGLSNEIPLDEDKGEDEGDDAPTI